jgi:hypothetical protein
MTSAIKTEVLTSIEDEKAAASRMLEVLEGQMPPQKSDRESVVIAAPLIRLVEASLLEIQAHGGKLDSSIIGMLSNASNLADILERTQTEKPSGEYNVQTSHNARAEILATLADDIMESGLVALPVISRRRNIARGP